MPHVSITGLTLHAPWHLPWFWRHTLASVASVRRSAGLISFDARQVGRTHHTLTVWQDEPAMRRFFAGPAHRRAMRGWQRHGTGRVLGYTIDAPPGWDEALMRLARDGRQL